MILGSIQFTKAFLPWTTSTSSSGPPTFRSSHHPHHGILPGLFQDFFLKQRESDFVPINKDDETEYGPGPLLIAYQIPSGILDEEIFDIIEDEAPKAASSGDGGVRVLRITTKEDDNHKNILSLSMKEALQQAMQVGMTRRDAKEKDGILSFASPDMDTPIPVLLFSGFRNKEMMAIYNVLGNEIVQENNQAIPACAKAVPNAMDKPLQQVLDEISGDHTDAMQIVTDS